MSTNQRYYRPGQYLFREGDPSHSMFLLKKGTVAIRKRRGSAQIEIARIYANEVLGELSFFDRQARSASAIALTECETIEIDFGSLDKMWKMVPDYMKTIMASVAERLRKANDMIRRLQKDVIVDENDGLESAKVNPEKLDAAQVLAATANIGAPEAPAPDGPKNPGPDALKDLGKVGEGDEKKPDSES